MYHVKLQATAVDYNLYPVVAASVVGAWWQLATNSSLETALC